MVPVVDLKEDLIRAKLALKRLAQSGTPEIPAQANQSQYQLIGYSAYRMVYEGILEKLTQAILKNDDREFKRYLDQIHHIIPCNEEELETFARVLNLSMIRVVDNSTGREMWLTIIQFLLKTIEKSAIAMNSGAYEKSIERYAHQLMLKVLIDRGRFGDLAKELGVWCLEGKNTMEYPSMPSVVMDFLMENTPNWYHAMTGDNLRSSWHSSSRVKWGGKSLGI